MSESRDGMKREEYDEIHDLEGSTEGGVHSGNGYIYVIQEHHAGHLHWDLRLEFDQVLRSWALPKEPPLEPGTRRLAVPTKDHPLEYADFEGTIPEGQYGAGTVKIWDRGVFEPLKTDAGKLIFRVNGQRLNGVYCLIRTAPRGGKEQWLFFKKKID